MREFATSGRLCLYAAFGYISLMQSDSPRHLTRQRPSRRPSVDACEAVLLALAGPLPPFVQTCTNDDGSCALILGGALRIFRARDALLTLRLRDGDGCWCETTSCDGALLLEPALLMEAALAHAVENALGAADALPPADRAYAQRRLRADLFPAATAERGTRGVRVVRRFLLREVADRAVLRVAGLIFGRTATFRDYNDIVRAGARTLVRVTGETPNLAPLLRGRVRQLACEGGGGADPGIFGAIRHGLVHTDPGMRIAPRDWKWLSHQTRATVEALSRREAVDDGAPLEPIALRLFACADLRRPPASLVALVAPGGALDRALEAMRADSGPARMADLARLVRLAAGEWQRRARSGHSSRFVRDDLGYLIDWWIDESAGRMPAVPPGATYPSLIRRQQRWHQLVIQRYPHLLVRWHSAVTAHEKAGVRVVPLTDSLMLAREGMEMRHCVASYARDCAGGHTRIFALELTGTGECATLELRRRASHWFAGQIKGSCNADVSVAMRAAAERLALRYASAERAR